MANLSQLAVEQQRIGDAYQYAIHAATLLEQIDHPYAAPAWNTLAYLTAQHGETELNKAWQTTTGNKPPPEILDHIRNTIVDLDFE